jgi:hypothetical protein
LDQEIISAKKVSYHNTINSYASPLKATSFNISNNLEARIRGGTGSGTGSGTKKNFAGLINSNHKVNGTFSNDVKLTNNDYPGPGN